MANNIEVGIKVNFDANGAIKNAEAFGEVLRKAFEGFKGNVNFNIAGVDKATVSTQQLDKATQQLTKSRVATAKQESLLGDLYEKNSVKAGQKYLTSISGLRQAYAKLNAESSRTAVVTKQGIVSLDSSAAAMTKVALKGDMAAKTFDNISNRMINSGRQMASTGRQLTMTLTLPIIAAATAAGKLAFELDKANRSLSVALTGRAKDFAGVTANVAELNKQSRSLSESFGMFSQIDISGTQEQLVKVAKNLEDVKALSKLTVEISAVAGTKDLTDATNLVSILYAQLGNNVQAVQKTIAEFNAVTSNTNLNMDDLIKSMPNAIGMFKAFNVDIGKGSLLLAAYTESGIDAKNAATAIARLLATLPAITANFNNSFNGKVGKDLRDFVAQFNQAHPDQAIGFFDAMGKRLDGNAAIYQLAKMFSFLNKNKPGDLAAFAPAALGKFMSQKTQEGFIQLGDLLNKNTTDAQQLNRAFQALNDDQVVDAFTKKVQTILNDPSTKMQAQIQGLVNSGRELGKELIPLATKLLEKVRGLVDAFTRLPNSTKQAIAGFAAFLAILGPFNSGLGTTKNILGTMLKYLVAAPLKALFSRTGGKLTITTVAGQGSGGAGGGTIISGGPIRPGSSPLNIFRTEKEAIEAERIAREASTKELAAFTGAIQEATYMTAKDMVVKKTPMLTKVGPEGHDWLRLREALPGGAPNVLANQTPVRDLQTAIKELEATLPQKMYEEEVRAAKKRIPGFVPYGEIGTTQEAATKDLEQRLPLLSRLGLGRTAATFGKESPFNLSVMAAADVASRPELAGQDALVAGKALELHKTLGLSKSADEFAQIFKAEGQDVDRVGLGPIKKYMDDTDGFITSFNAHLIKWQKQAQSLGPRRKEITAWLDENITPLVNSLGNNSLGGRFFLSEELNQKVIELQDILSEKSKHPLAAGLTKDDVRRTRRDLLHPLESLLPDTAQGGLNQGLYDAVGGMGVNRSGTLAILKELQMKRMLPAIESAKTAPGTIAPYLSAIVAGRGTPQIMTGSISSEISQALREGAETNRISTDFHELDAPVLGRIKARKEFIDRVEQEIEAQQILPQLDNSTIDKKIRSLKEDSQKYLPERQLIRGSTKLQIDNIVKSVRDIEARNEELISTKNFLGDKTGSIAKELEQNATTIDSLKSQIAPIRADASAALENMAQTQRNSFIHKRIMGLRKNKGAAEGAGSLGYNPTYILQKLQEDGYLLSGRGTTTTDSEEQIIKRLFELHGSDQTLDALGGQLPTSLAGLQATRHMSIAQWFGIDENGNKINGYKKPSMKDVASGTAYDRFQDRADPAIRQVMLQNLGYEGLGNESYTDVNKFRQLVIGKGRELIGNKGFLTASKTASGIFNEAEDPLLFAKALGKQVDKATPFPQDFWDMVSLRLWGGMDRKQMMKYLTDSLKAQKGLNGEAKLSKEDQDFVEKYNHAVTNASARVAHSYGAGSGTYAGDVLAKEQKNEALKLMGAGPVNEQAQAQTQANVIRNQIAELQRKEVEAKKAQLTRANEALRTAHGTRIGDLENTGSMLEPMQIDEDVAMRDFIKQINSPEWLKIHENEILPSMLKTSSGGKTKRVGMERAEMRRTASKILGQARKSGETVQPEFYTPRFPTGEYESKGKLIGARPQERKGRNALVGSDEIANESETALNNLKENSLKLAQDWEATTDELDARAADLAKAQEALAKAQEFEQGSPQFKKFKQLSGRRNSLSTTLASNKTKLASTRMEAWKELYNPNTSTERQKAINDLLTTIDKSDPIKAIDQEIESKAAALDEVEKMLSQPQTTKDLRSLNGKRGYLTSSLKKLQSNVMSKRSEMLNALTTNMEQDFAAELRKAYEESDEVVKLKNLIATQEAEISNLGQQINEVNPFQAMPVGAAQRKVSLSQTQLSKAQGEAAQAEAAFKANEEEVSRVRREWVEGVSTMGTSVSDQIGPGANAESDLAILSEAMKKKYSKNTFRAVRGRLSQPMMNALEEIQVKQLVNATDISKVLTKHTGTVDPEILAALTAVTKRFGVRVQEDLQGFQQVFKTNIVNDMQRIAAEQQALANLPQSGTELQTGADVRRGIWRRLGAKFSSSKSGSGGYMPDYDYDPHEEAQIEKETDQQGYEHTQRIFKSNRITQAQKEISDALTQAEKELNAAQLARDTERTKAIEQRYQQLLGIQDDLINLQANDMVTRKSSSRASKQMEKQVAAMKAEHEARIKLLKEAEDARKALEHDLISELANQNETEALNRLAEDMKLNPQMTNLEAMQRYMAHNNDIAKGHGFQFRSKNGLQEYEEPATTALKNKGLNEEQMGARAIISKEGEKAADAAATQSSPGIFKRFFKIFGKKGTEQVAKKETEEAVAPAAEKAFTFGSKAAVTDTAAGGGSGIIGGLATAVGGAAPLIAIIAAIVAAIALIAGAIILVKQHWDDFKSEITRGIAAVKSGFETLKNAIINPFKAAARDIDIFNSKSEGSKKFWKDFGVVFNSVLKNVGSAFRVMAEVLGPVFQVIARSITVVFDIIKAIIAALSGDWSSVGDALKGVFRNLADGTREVYAALLKDITGLVVTVIKVIGNEFLSFFEGMIHLASKVAHALHLPTADLIDDADKVIKGFQDKFNGGLNSLPDLFSDWLIPKTGYEQQGADAATKLGKELVNVKKRATDMAKNAGLDDDATKQFVDNFVSAYQNARGKLNMNPTEAFNSALAVTQADLDALKKDASDGLGLDTSKDQAALEDANQKMNEFSSAFQGTLGKLTDGWKQAALTAFDQYAERQKKALTTARKKHADTIDAQIKDIERQQKAEEDAEREKEYLLNKQQLAEERALNQSDFKNTFDKNMYAGNYDEAKDALGKHLEDIAKFNKDDQKLDQDHAKDLAKQALDARKQALEDQKTADDQATQDQQTALDQQLQQQRANLEQQLNTITEFAPKTAAEAAAMQEKILGALGKYTGSYHDIAVTQSDAWKKTWSDAFGEAQAKINDDAFWAGRQGIDAFAAGLGVPVEAILGADAASGPPPIQKPEASGPTGPQTGQKLFQHTGGTFGSWGKAPSDIDVTLQSGEYVIQRKAAQSLGLNTLNQLNQAHIAKPKFHSGGAVIAEQYDAKMMNVFGQFIAGKTQLGGKNFSDITPLLSSGLSGMADLGQLPNYVKGMLSGVKEGAVELLEYVLGNFPNAILTATTNGKHVNGSYHYKGQAIDVDFGGNHMQDDAIFKLLEPLAQKGTLAELFFDPDGGYKDGIKIGAIGGHLDHVHAAVADAFANGLQALMQQATQTLAPVTGSVQDYVKGQMAGMGWGDDQWSPLYQLVSHESGWNPAAKNPGSTAAGLFQFLDSTWDAYITKQGGPKYWNQDVAWQTKAGLQYIKNRYGTPNNAWSTWQSRSPHWYHTGGMVFPSLDVGGKILSDGFAKVHKNERVLNPSETAAYESSSKLELNLHFDGGFFGSDREIQKLADTIEKKIVPKMQRAYGNERRMVNR